MFCLGLVSSHHDPPGFLVGVSQLGVFYDEKNHDLTDLRMEKSTVEVFFTNGGLVRESPQNGLKLG